MSDVNQQMIDGFTAQLDAHKQALNEYIQANLMMKTQMNMNNKIFKDLNDKLEAANKRIAELEQPTTPQCDLNEVKENVDAA